MRREGWIAMGVVLVAVGISAADAVADPVPGALEATGAFERARSATDRLLDAVNAAHQAGPDAEAAWSKARAEADHAHGEVSRARRLLQQGRDGGKVGDAVWASMLQALGVERRRVSTLAAIVPEPSLPARDAADPGLQARADERLAKAEARLGEALEGAGGRWGSELVGRVDGGLAGTRGALEAIRSLRAAATQDPARRSDLVGAADRVSRFMRRWEMEWAAFEGGMDEALHLRLVVGLKPKPRRGGGLVGALEGVADQMTPEEERLEKVVELAGEALPGTLVLD